MLLWGPAILEIIVKVYPIYAHASEFMLSNWFENYIFPKNEKKYENKKIKISNEITVVETPVS